MRTERTICALFRRFLSHTNLSPEQRDLIVTEFVSNVDADGIEFGCGCDVWDFIALESGLYRVDENGQPESCLSTKSPSQISAMIEWERTSTSSTVASTSSTVA